LQNPFSVVISQNIAKKYFRDEDPVGKTIRYNNSYDFVITGVAGKIPSNSSIEFDFVTSISSLASIAAKENGKAIEENFLNLFLLKQRQILVSRTAIIKIRQPKSNWQLYWYTAQVYDYQKDRHFKYQIPEDISVHSFYLIYWH
jgi:putative ABC transport system permease protein